MQKKSILLALSGSEQSQQAAQVAWAIAKRTDSKLLAQHVVDTKSAWAFLGFEKPGLIGSGMYISAYESLCTSLREIGKKLAEKYEAMSGSQGIGSVCVVDEGSPLDQICLRAKDADLVITGHRRVELTEHDAEACADYSPKQSLADDLANKCPKPLLMVQGQCKPWTTLKILVSIEHLNFQFVSECLRLAEILDLCPKLICLSSGTHEEPAVQLITDLRAAHPKFSNLTIEIVGVGGGIDVSRPLWSEHTVHLELAAAEEDLFVVSTEEIAGKRLTVFGTTTSAFIQALKLPNVLFYPEENLKNLDKNVDEKSEFDSTQEIVAAHTR